MWQLADELRVEIVRLTSSGEAARDRRFCNQIRAASASATSNLSEGFSRFRPREFAHFALIARGSLGETWDQLRDGIIRAYWQESDVQRASRLCIRTIAGISRLVKYLRSCNPPRGTGSTTNRF